MVCCLCAKSTSYNLVVGRQGPTRRKGSKGGVSGPSEDLSPVAEVGTGVNFRPAGGAQGLVAGSPPRRQPGTGTRRVTGGAVNTFPPPGGSWYPIRVTWTWIGHQAINLAGRRCVETHSRGFGC